jgi:hypothetical protein
MANKLKKVLAGLGERLNPSIKKERLASEAKTKATDEVIRNIVHKRNMRKRKNQPSLPAKRPRSRTKPTRSARSAVLTGR